MTDLLLDPPSPVLRLVSSADVPARDARYRDSITLGAESRRIYRAVLAWSFQRQQGVDPDALRVVLAVRQARQPAPLTRFTTDDVWRLMMVDIVAWCRARHLPVPDRAAHAILVAVTALALTGQLHPDSDPIDDVEQALGECTGGWVELLDI